MYYISCRLEKQTEFSSTNNCYPLRTYSYTMSTSHRNPKKSYKKSLVIFPFFSQWKRMLSCSLCSPKTTYFAIFANLGQLWMVVYTAIIKMFEIKKSWIIRSILFLQKKLFRKNWWEGVTLTPPPLSGIGLIDNANTINNYSI